MYHCLVLYEWLLYPRLDGLRPKGARSLFSSVFSQKKEMSRLNKQTEYNNLFHLITSQVDNDGCIDLSGILKVTAGYGKPGKKLVPICCVRCYKEIFWLSNIFVFSVVSLAVMSGKKEIFKKESHVEIRELRLLTEVINIFCFSC